MSNDTDCCLNSCSRSTISPKVTLCVAGTQQYRPSSFSTVSTPSNSQRCSLPSMRSNIPSIRSSMYSNSSSVALSFTVNSSSFATAQQKVLTAELYFGLLCPIRLGKRYTATLAPVSLAYWKKSSSPAFFERPYSESPNLPANVAWTEDDSMIVALFPYFLSVSRSLDVNPKFPRIKSSGFSGRFTPARWNTKSADLQ